MSRVSKFICLSFLAFAPLFCATAQDGCYDDALDLYGRGLYARAMSLFQNLPGYGDEPLSSGYAVLCAQKLRIDGYGEMADDYLSRFPGGILETEIRFEKASDLFDRSLFTEALDEFRLISPAKLKKSVVAEYTFKKGYCFFKSGDNVSAMFDFSNVDHMLLNDYSAPARYCAGYIRYGEASFEEALSWFRKAAADERFTPIADYYTIMCKFELHDYEFVTGEGLRMYESTVPADRRQQSARVISESFLVLGDVEKARTFYDSSQDGSPRSRADFFYAGSLMFAAGDWQGAVDNYSAMPDKTDSLGQIAWYNTALSFLNLKNKVAALDAFRMASLTGYDEVMTEDAMFNRAKLAFDLNGDTSVFHEYLRKYSDSMRGEKIYSYMALAALAEKDYQTAIDSYDKIEMLEGNDRSNYVKANYLRGSELMSGGSYRRAGQCFAAVTYYSEKDDPVNQMARFAIAESCYLDGRYEDARDKFTELYNNSSLYGKAQGDVLSYNVAYSCLGLKDYEKAVQWFGRYCSDGGTACRKDAMLRKADCLMALGQYKEAALSYQEVLEGYFDVNDIYPYYRAAVAYGLLKKGAGSGKKLELLENVMKADSSAAYYGEAMYELGRTYQDGKQTAKAVACLRKLVDVLPSSPFAARALLDLGTINRSAGNAEAALDSYRAVVEGMPSSGYADDALLAIESIYQAQNKPYEYFAYLERIGRGESKTDEEKEAMAFAALENVFYSGDFQRALEAVRDFRAKYPESQKLPALAFYEGECFAGLGDKLKACDAYSAVMSSNDTVYRVKALARFAETNLSLENFAVACDAFDTLLSVSPDSAILAMAETGLMRSAFRAKRYEKAVDASLAVTEGRTADPGLTREARMTCAQSLLSLSRRDEAFAILSVLAEDPDTQEGARACYMIIQDSFDKGDFQSVTENAYRFGESGTSQQYWLARAFLILGDAFAEQGKFKQARATFQSIADGYSGDDEVAEELKIRIDRLNEMNL